MASAEPQKELLTLISGFACERSRGERRVSDLRKRLVDLESEIAAANGELDEAKREKEAAEQELRASQVQLNMSDAAIFALEKRTSLLQEEISKLTSELSALKDQDDVLRNSFIAGMIELNRDIRNFQGMVAKELQREDRFGFTLEDEMIQDIDDDMSESRYDVLAVVEKIQHANDLVRQLEWEIEDGQAEHDKVLRELSEIKEKRALVEAIMEEMKQLKELAGHTAELEKTDALLAEELRRKYTCPSCGVSNMVVPDEEEMHA